MAPPPTLPLAQFPRDAAAIRNAFRVPWTRHFATKLACHHPAISMRLVDAMARAHVALGKGEKPPDGEAVGPLRRLHGQLTQLLDTVEDVDARPTPAVQKAVDETIARLDEQLARRGSPP